MRKRTISYDTLFIDLYPPLPHVLLQCVSFSNGKRHSQRDIAHKERHFLYLKADARRIENLTTNKQEPHTRSSQNKTYKCRSVPPFSIAGPFPFKHRNVAFFCRHTSSRRRSVGGGLCWSRRQNNNSEIGDDASMPGGMICIAVLRRRTEQKGVSKQWKMVDAKRTNKPKASSAPQGTCDLHRH